MSEELALKRRHLVEKEAVYLSRKKESVLKSKAVSPWNHVIEVDRRMTLRYNTEIRKIIYIVVILSKDIVSTEGWLVSYVCGY